MQIQVNTDHNIEGREALAEHVKGVVEHAVVAFESHITRVEVHLSEERHGSGGDNQRCLMEVRVEGRPASAVTHHAETMHQSIDGAAHRMKHALEHALHRHGGDHR